MARPAARRRSRQTCAEPPPAPGLEQVDRRAAARRRCASISVAIAVAAGVVELLSRMTISSGAISETNGMLPAMKITEPYSPTARAKREREAGQQRRQQRRQHDAAERSGSRAGAERGGGLLDLAVELLQHRLHGAHDEGQADEDERDEDAERRVGDLDAERREELADPAVRRVERGQRDAGDRRRQREGQVDERRRAAGGRETRSAPAPRRRSGRRRR